MKYVSRALVSYRTRVAEEKASSPPAFSDCSSGVPPRTNGALPPPPRRCITRLHAGSQLFATLTTANWLAPVSSAIAGPSHADSRDGRVTDAPHALSTRTRCYALILFARMRGIARDFTLSLRNAIVAEEITAFAHDFLTLDGNNGIHVVGERCDC